MKLTANRTTLDVEKPTVRAFRRLNRAGDIAAVLTWLAETVVGLGQFCIN